MWAKCIDALPLHRLIKEFSRARVRLSNYVWHRKVPLLPPRFLAKLSLANLAINLEWCHGKPSAHICNAIYLYIYGT